MSKALEKRNTMKDMVRKYQGEFEQALPSMVKPERFVRVALTQFTKVPKLLDCTPESVISSLLTASSMGLEVDGRVAHLLPYGDKAQLIVDYKGLVELAMRSGLVSFIHADVVCENDEFEENMGEVLHHKVNRRGDRGEPYAVYTRVKMKDGTESFYIMSWSEVEEIRDNHSIGYRSALKYKKKDNPWMTRPNEMAKKTCFRQHSKWLPLSSEFRDAVETDPDVAPKPLDITPEVELVEPDDVPDIDAGVSVNKKNSPPEENDPSVDDSDQSNVNEDAPEEEPANEHEPKEGTKLKKGKGASLTDPAPKRTLENPDA